MPGQSDRIREFLKRSGQGLAGDKLARGNFIHDMASDLKLALGLTVITLAFVFVPYANETIIRPALGLVLVLFLPGYAFIAALFPGKADISDLERAALSFGLSIALVPLIGFTLNYTSWGIQLKPITISLAIFTVACLLVANGRRLLLPPPERFSIDFVHLFGEAKKSVLRTTGSRLDRALSIILMLSILTSVSTLAYVIAVPKEGEKFTEFYLLGPNGKAVDYPISFVLGEQQPIIVGVVNHEFRNVTYDIIVQLTNSNRSTILYTDKVALDNNQTWEKTINLKPDRVGTNMMMEFLLYADGNMANPYRETHLRVSVV
jgi:uncharacterized membrane protein